MTTNQVIYLVEQLVYFGAIDEADVRLSQEPSDFSLKLQLDYIHHDHKGNQVVENCRQQPVLIVFQSLAVHVGQGSVPAKKNTSYSMTMIT